MIHQANLRYISLLPSFYGPNKTCIIISDFSSDILYLYTLAYKEWHSLNKQKLADDVIKLNATENNVISWSLHSAKKTKWRWVTSSHAVRPAATTYTIGFICVWLNAIIVINSTYTQFRHEFLFSFSPSLRNRSKIFTLVLFYEAPLYEAKFKA